MKKSIWQKNLISKNITPLKRKEVQVDVAIIGGGICGVTTAERLKETNLKVAVLEGRTIAAANTGKSTGNLYVLTDTPLQEMVKKHNIETVQKVLNARKEALNLIEQLINKYQINCDFKKVPWTLFSGTASMDRFVEEEYQVAKKLDLLSEWLDASDPLLKPFNGRCALKVEGQAQFNPYSYVNDLAEKIHDEKVSIYENAHVDKIQKDEDGFILHVGKSIVYAKKIIEATHTPLEFSPLQTVVAPYREYGLARKLKSDFHDAIYWWFYDEDKVFSLRKHHIQEEQYIITVGTPHKVGQGNAIESMSELHHTLDRLALHDNESESIEWSGQHFRSSDNLPFIGEGFDRDILICSGFSTDGLIYGTLAATLFKDILLNKENEYFELFKPHRVTSFGTKKFIQENINVIEQYVVDYLKTNETDHPEKGEGKIISYRGDKFAVSKDNEGNLSVCSGICTHMGCVVHWNNLEKSWDCPCHGSRFTDRGLVLEGPAIKSLFEDSPKDS